MNTPKVIRRDSSAEEVAAGRKIGGLQATDDVFLLFSEDDVRVRDFKDFSKKNISPDSFQTQRKALEKE
jgi:hypothetical protein